MNGSATAAPVLVAGPAYCDLLFSGLADAPVLGTERFASGFDIAAGGSAIPAVALARLGRPVALLAQLGRDALGDAVTAALEAEGVDTRWLRRARGASTPVTAVLSTPEDRAFVTHLPRFTAPSRLEAALAGSGARHLHVGGFPFARARPDAASVAREHGATVSFDPGWDAAALADPAVRRLALACDVLLPNRLEAALLCEAEGTAAELLERLAARRPGRVTVIKDGAAGACGSDGGAPVAVAAPPVRAVDPTGAGDVFDAGFLDAYLAGLPLEACLERGASCGAAAVTAVGGTAGAPYRTAGEARP